MGLAILAFLVMTAAVAGGWMIATHLPEFLAGRRMQQRLRDVSALPEPSISLFWPRIVQSPKVSAKRSPSNALRWPWTRSLVALNPIQTAGPVSVVGSRYQGSRIAACTSSGDIGVPVSKESIGLNSNVNSPSECNGQGFVQRAVGLRRAAPARTPPLVESGAVLPEDQVGQVIERFRVDRNAPPSAARAFRNDA